MHALGLEFGSAAQLSKRPGGVLNCLWGNALKRSPGIIRKRRVSYPVPGFLSSATWPSLPKKHYNGLNQTKQIYELKYCTDFLYQLEYKLEMLQNDDVVMFIRLYSIKNLNVRTLNDNNLVILRTTTLINRISNNI